MEFAAFPAKPRPMEPKMSSTGRGNKNGPVSKEGAEPQYWNYSEIILLKMMLLSGIQPLSENRPLLCWIL